MDQCLLNKPTGAHLCRLWSAEAVPFSKDEYL